MQYKCLHFSRYYQRHGWISRFEVTLLSLISSCKLVVAPEPRHHALDLHSHKMTTLRNHEQMHDADPRKNPTYFLAKLTIPSATQKELNSSTVYNNDFKPIQDISQAILRRYLVTRSNFMFGIYCIATHWTYRLS